MAHNFLQGLAINSGIHTTNKLCVFQTKTKQHRNFTILVSVLSVNGVYVFAIGKDVGQIPVGCKFTCSNVQGVQLKIAHLFFKRTTVTCLKLCIAHRQHIIDLGQNIILGLDFVNIFPCQQIRVGYDIAFLDFCQYILIVIRILKVCRQFVPIIIKSVGVVKGYLITIVVFKLIFGPKGSAAQFAVHKTLVVVFGQIVLIGPSVEKTTGYGGLLGQKILHSNV